MFFSGQYLLVIHFNSVCAYGEPTTEEEIGGVWGDWDEPRTAPAPEECRRAEGREYSHHDNR